MSVRPPTPRGRATRTGSRKRSRASSDVPRSRLPPPVMTTLPATSSTGPSAPSISSRTRLKISASRGLITRESSYALIAWTLPPADVISSVRSVSASSGRAAPYLRFTRSASSKGILRICARSAVT